MCPRVGTDRADLRHSPPSSIKRLRHTRDHLRQLLPVYYRHGGKQWGGSGLASDRSSPSRKQIGNSPRSHNAIGWCRSTSSSMGGRSPHPWKRGPSRVVPGVFRRIRLVPGRAMSIPMFSSVAAVDRKCSPCCVRRWEPTGRTSGSHPPRRENASVTPGTTSDNYFRFTAAMLESTHDDQKPPSRTRRWNLYVVLHSFDELRHHQYCPQSNRLLWRVFPIGSDVIAEVFPVMGSGVRSAHVKSRTSAVKNRQYVEFVAPCHRHFTPQPWFLTRIYILPTESLIPRKFGVPGYHRFCAAPPTHVCGGQTYRQTALP